MTGSGAAVTVRARPSATGRTRATRERTAGRTSAAPEGFAGLRLIGLVSSAWLPSDAVQLRDLFFLRSKLTDTATSMDPMVIGVAPAAIDRTTDFSCAVSSRMMTATPSTMQRRPRIQMTLYFMGLVWTG